MDLILYRYLLRRLVFYPITFSRNKNFNSYTSEEGQKAISRAKVLKKIINNLNNSDDVMVNKNDSSYTITVRDDSMHLENKYVIDLFEKEIITEMTNKFLL